MKTCPTCGHEWPDEDQFCLNDGTALPEAESGLVGTEWAGYNILAKLGEGGMGAVYLGEHTRMRRKTAIKVMSQDALSTPGAVARFNREAENASRISHPNVCTIYDFGETFDGILYLAMEFIEGEALTRVVQREGKIAAPRAAEIVRQVADGLAAAHDLSIVHRDLKPDNIMVAQNPDGSVLVKVVDFGIAKAMGPGDDQRVTRTGLAVGTPAYMSPEQLLGQTVDGRTDIYSLGLVFFWMLTGRLPFDVPDTEMMMARLTQEPMRLSDACPDEQFPAALQQALDMALQQTPEDRCRDVGTFRDAVVRAVERGDETASVTEPSRIPPKHKESAAVAGTQPAAPQPHGSGSAPDTPAPARPAPTTPSNRAAKLVAAVAGIGVLGLGGWFGVARFGLGGGRDVQPLEAGGQPPVIEAEHPAEPQTPPDPGRSGNPGLPAISAAEVAALGRETDDARARASATLSALGAQVPGLARDLQESSSRAQSLRAQLGRAAEVGDDQVVASLVSQLRAANRELDRRTSAAAAGQVASLAAAAARRAVQDAEQVLGSLAGVLPLLESDIRTSQQEAESLGRQIELAIAAGSADDMNALGGRLTRSTDVLAGLLEFGGLNFVARIIVERDDGVVDAIAFAVRQDGTLITTKHVLEGASGTQEVRRIAIQFVGSNQTFGADVVSISPDADLALVRARGIASEVPTVRGFNLRADTLPVGSTVAVIGVTPRDAGGLPRRTIATGALQQAGSDVLQLEATKGGSLFEGGAAGTSGSPMLDGNGELVGVLFGGQDGGRIVLGALARFGVRLLNND